MFGGGGGLNPRKMKQMMEQMGIEMEELAAERVVIELADGDALVFDDADVTKMEARGQSTFQVIGDPETRAASSASAIEGESAGSGAGVDADADADADDAGNGGAGIPDDDVALVVERTGASAASAREALEAENGDLAAAISRLE